MMQATAEECSKQQTQTKQSSMSCLFSRVNEHCSEVTKESGIHRGKVQVASKTVNLYKGNKKMHSGL